MKKITTVRTPALAGVIREANERAAIAEIKNCFYHGADMIDLHMSCLDKSDVDTLKRIIDSTPLPVLALNYNMGSSWEPLNLSEEDRVAYFKRAVEAGAAGIDMQGYTFHAESKTQYLGDEGYSFAAVKPFEVVTDSAIIDKQCEFIDWVHANGSEVLLSCHPGRVMNCEQIVDLALFLEKRKPDVIKLVSLAETDEDLVEAFKTMTVLKKEVKTAVSFHVGGARGDLSRIINPMLGGHMIFCVDSYDSNSTLGQLDLQTTRQIIDGMKKVGGMI